MSNRFDPAPADGGISLDAQEDEARERDEEERRDAYLAALDREIRAHARDVVGILRMDGSKYELLKAVSDVIYWGVREGVKRAESGQVAEWILDTE
jgi:hypothetical protein